NDASSEDNFLASPMLSSITRGRLRSASYGLFLAHDLIGKPLHTFPDHALARLCVFRRLIGNGKWPGAVKLMELPFGLRQPIGDGPERGRVDADPDMACEADLDVLGGIGGTQQAGLP